MSNDFADAEIPASGFEGDDGQADPDLREAIVEYARTASAESARELLDLLVVSRLLVPVLAVVDAIVDGQEKDSHMQSVEFQSVDGRKALIAFTGTDAVEYWDPAARPIPRHAYEVAQGAVEQGYDAIVLDMSGPTPLAVDGNLLSLLAIGPQRFDLLELELAKVCDLLTKVTGITSAKWELEDDEAIITISVSEISPTLSVDVSAVISDSDLNALLDCPLNVEVQT